MWILNFFLIIFVTLLMLAIIWVSTTAFIAWYDTTDFDLYSTFVKFFRERRKDRR